MFTANRAGYKKGISQYIIDNLRSEASRKKEEVVLDVDTATAGNWNESVLTRILCFYPIIFVSWCDFVWFMCLFKVIHAVKSITS